MTGEKFAEIVTKRAHERVNIKIKNFKESLYQAFRNLTGDSFISATSTSNQGTNRAIIESILEADMIDFSDGWPSLIWKNEEELVTKELLSMMDEMQKALLSPEPKEGDCKPGDQQK